jgi:hypothetical protein
MAILTETKANTQEDHVKQRKIELLPNLYFIYEYFFSKIYSFLNRLETNICKV